MRDRVYLQIELWLRDFFQVMTWVSYKNQGIWIDYRGQYLGFATLTGIKNEFINIVEINRKIVQWQISPGVHNDLTDWTQWYRMMIQKLLLQDEIIKEHILRIDQQIDFLNRTRGGSQEVIDHRIHILEYRRRSIESQNDSYTRLMNLLEIIQGDFSRVYAGSFNFQKQKRQYEELVIQLKRRVRDYDKLISDIRVYYPGYVKELNDFLLLKNQYIEHKMGMADSIDRLEEYYQKTNTIFQKDLSQSQAIPVIKDMSPLDPEMERLASKLFG